MSMALLRTGDRVSDIAKACSLLLISISVDLIYHFFGLHISTTRREDYEVNKGHFEYEDQLQRNNVASIATTCGHRFPVTFVIFASGLEKTNVSRCQLFIVQR